MCVQYTLRDRASLDAYLRDHAPRMRAEGEARFGGRFRASRRVLECVPGARLAFQLRLQPGGAVAHPRSTTGPRRSASRCCGGVRCASTARSARSVGVIARNAASSGARCAGGTCSSNGCSSGEVGAQRRPEQPAAMVGGIALRELRAQRLLLVRRQCGEREGRGLDGELLVRRQRLPRRPALASHAPLRLGHRVPRRDASPQRLARAGRPRRPQASRAQLALQRRRQVRQPAPGSCAGSAMPRRRPPSAASAAAQLSAAHAWFPAGRRQRFRRVGQQHRRGGSGTGELRRVPGVEIEIAPSAASRRSASCVEIAMRQQRSPRRTCRRAASAAGSAAARCAGRRPSGSVAGRSRRRPPRRAGPPARPPAARQRGCAGAAARRPQVRRSERTLAHRRQPAEALGRQCWIRCSMRARRPPPRTRRADVPAGVAHGVLQRTPEGPGATRAQPRPGLVQPRHQPQQQRRRAAAAQRRQRRHRRRPMPRALGVRSCRRGQQQAPERGPAVRQRSAGAAFAERPHRRGHGRVAARRRRRMQLGEHGGAALDAAQEGRQRGRVRA